MRLIDANEVKKRFPIMVNGFGMVVNETLHKELDKIPTVNAVSEEVYTREYNLKQEAEMKAYKLKKAIKEIREDISANNLGLDMDKANLEGLIVINLTRKVIIELIDRKVKEHET